MFLCVILILSVSMCVLVVVWFFHTKLSCYMISCFCLMDFYVCPSAVVAVAAAAGGA